MSKVSWTYFFAGFQLKVLKIKYFLDKKAVLHETTLMHCKARQGLHNLFSTNQGNDSEVVFVTGATKINFNNLKTFLTFFYQI